MERAPGSIDLWGAAEGFEAAQTSVVALPGIRLTVTFDLRPTPTGGMVAASDDFTCFVTENGSARCWGKDSPGDAPAIGLQRVVAGELHACGLAGDGSAYCWGRNERGQLGNGDRESSTSPVPPVTDERFDIIVAGGMHTCAISPTQVAWCWGGNGRGQLGNDGDDDSDVPTRVATARRWVALAGGNQFTCGIDVDGRLYCWGDDSNEQLGSRRTVYQRDTPEPVAAPVGMRTVATGRNHACATDRDGSTYCWGADMFAFFFGGGPGHDPQLLETTETFVTLAIGDRFACGLTKDGAVFCWGKNDRGQLGGGSEADSREPVRVALPAPVVDLTAGWAHACAVTRDRRLFCWGNNREGQVSPDPDVGETVVTPVQVELEP
jgi:alpha-tubulin suppressor-like RCC1 family protein